MQGQILQNVLGKRKFSDSREGFVLVTTLMFVALMVILCTRIFEQSSSFCSLGRTVVLREKARHLAIGGVQLALSLVCIDLEKEPKTEKDGEPKKVTQEDAFKKLLSNIWPYLNVLRSFELKEKVDGLDGKVGICIVGEDGKINLNHLYNLKEKKLVGILADKESDKTVDFLSSRIKELSGVKNFPVALSKFLEERDRVLDDSTEVMGDKNFASWKDAIFYSPEVGVGPSKKVYLTDLFTTWSKSGKLNPWVLSRSVLNMIGVEPAKCSSLDEAKKKSKEMAGAFKANIGDITAEWEEVFAPLYGSCSKEGLEVLKSMLNPKFELQSFSVLSCGEVNGVIQKLFAILERCDSAQEGGLQFKVAKVYWL